MNYDNYVLKLSQKINSTFEEIEAEYNFELGNEFEVVLCNILRDFLPEKFGVCRGFVVDELGNKAGDDIIIFDQVNFPTLRTLGNNQFLRKENIPIEAVYAYI